jgi:hypothetical protein
MGEVVSHTHSMVAIYRNGVRLALPALIGLQGCAYETHTHDRTGVVHVEPSVARTITVGQFFGVWGQQVSQAAVAGITGPVRTYVISNGTLSRFDGNPADVAFAPHKEIIFITGTAPVVLPRYRWPSGL